MTWKKTLVLTLVASAFSACDGADSDAAYQDNAQPAGTQAPRQASTAPAGTSNLPGERPPATNPAGSILAWSTPAAGSTVGAPVNELVLHFEPPARLSEVTVAGPEGAMPMMGTAVGEVSHYSLPLPELGPGAYTVAWRATRQGQPFQGSFGFTVG